MKPRTSARKVEQWGSVLDPQAAQGPASLAVDGIACVRRSARREEADMSVTGLIILLVIGAIAGWLAGLIMKANYGLVGDIVVGVIGSLIGGWLFGLLGIAAGGLIGSIIAAVVGAVILLALLRLIKRA
jgi:uncharacterized membrane protein YeaQ/YmgE (transglycosylase-associated protein family)